jgi:hypothetical protein
MVHRRGVLRGYCRHDTLEHVQQYAASANDKAPHRIIQIDFSEKLVTQMEVGKDNEQSS